LSKIITCVEGGGGWSNTILFTIYDAHFVCEMYARSDKSVRTFDKMCTHVLRGYTRQKKLAPEIFSYF
jgi:hypothetical protein